MQHVYANGNGKTISTFILAYAKKYGISPAAVTKRMDSGSVNVVEIEGGRLILEP